MRTMRNIVGKVVSFILVTALVALACFVTLFVIMVAPIPGISMLAGGLAFVFRRRIGWWRSGVIIIFLGCALMADALTSSEPWQDVETMEFSEWVADARRNPCGEREALVLMSIALLATGCGMLVWRITGKQGRPYPPFTST